MKSELDEAGSPMIHDDPVVDDRDEDREERREIEERAPGNDKLRAFIGTFQPPPGTFDDEEMAY